MNTLLSLPINFFLFCTKSAIQFSKLLQNFVVIYWTPFWYSDMFTGRMCRLFLFFVNLLWISLLREKYAKLLTKNSIKGNIYCEGIVTIPIILKCGLHEHKGLIPNIVLTILLRWRNILLLSIKLPRKNIPYTIAEWVCMMYHLKSFDIATMLQASNNIACTVQYGNITQYSFPNSYVYQFPAREILHLFPLVTVHSYR